jgi:hypothetical protein
MPYHGKRGVIVGVSTGKPRNHLVQVGSEIVSIPCGNLLKGGV